MSSNKQGPNAVGHNSVFSAVTTALFDMFSNKGQLPPLGDQRIDGKTCLVTGANSGLGKAVAIDLAKRGGHVIMACRSGIPEAGEDVKRLSGSDQVEMMQVDLSDMQAVSEFCDSLQARNIQLDITVMNAGLMPLNSRHSAQGYELMFAVHFLANRLMLSRMVSDGVIAQQPDKPPARVIFVSSEAHQSSAPIDFDQFGAYVEYGLKDGLKHYGTSKLHLTTFANELSRRLNPDYQNGSGEVNIAVHALCPGPIASNIARESPGFLRPIIGPIMRLFFNSPEAAAAPIMLLACAESMADKTGVYLHMMREKPCSELAADPANGQQLWDKSAALLSEFLAN
ncbi:MAG: SDR family NAD(P)-dependent oxidoreductase [Pseudomonadales bacterium]|nr:SDR family NAD(P)-dependent oxidoreductase [Pseudomonadales bacterium]